jgi:hypothetical protein
MQRVTRNAATLAAADPADTAKVHAEVGLDITCHQVGRGVVESRPRVAESGFGELEKRKGNAWRLSDMSPLPGAGAWPLAVNFCVIDDGFGTLIGVRARVR